MLDSHSGDGVAATVLPIGPVIAPRSPPRVKPQRSWETVGDPLEREADRTAAAVVRAATSAGGTLPAKRQAVAMSETAPRQSGHEACPRPVAAALSRPGLPLAADLRSYFEPRFGQSFSHVRIHDDAAARKAAGGIAARAFTFGHRIAFAAGEYAPGTSEGRRLLAHELAHVVQQREGGERIQRAPSKDDQLADAIDQHPAWGTWIGGSGSVEGYQELEQNVSGGEAGFYRSAEFRAWYMSGWRGLQRFEDPTKALQFVASVLITDAAARANFFSDIRIGGPGGQMGKVSGDLDQARKTGSVDTAVAAIEQVSAARNRENMAAFTLSDYDSMAQGRKLWSGPGVNTFERWTLAGVEASPDEISNALNREFEQHRQVPQISKDWKWFEVDVVAGVKKVHSEHLSKDGKFPAKALGGVSARYYKLSDGRIITREFWHRAKPGAEDRGRRMLQMIWATIWGRSVCHPSKVGPCTVPWARTAQ